MSDKTTIEWTDATWNPVRGCSRVSEGCRNCYAERMAARFSGPGLWAEGLAQNTPDGPRWTGRVELVPDKLDQPLRWKRPRRVFVNSMSDLFHEGLSNEAIAAVFGVMAACPQHTFQVLTKRPERMRDWFRWMGYSPAHGDLAHAIYMNRATHDAMGGRAPGATRVNLAGWPLSNVWLGVSVEDQATADARIPLLLDTPAAVRFVSAEPLLGPVDLEPFLQFPPFHDDYKMTMGADEWQGVDWVITGGESGPRARPAHPQWFRDIRDACAAAEVAYFHKQNGGWAINSRAREVGHVARPGGWGVLARDGVFHAENTGWNGRDIDPDTGEAYLVRIGKHDAGRLLDGREHHAFPGGGA